MVVHHPPCTLHLKLLEGELRIWGLRFNTTTPLAADAGHEVAILTRKPAQWNAADIGFVNDDLGW